MHERTFSPIKHDRAFEAVVRQIETAIFDGTYKVGDHLPSERALVEQFQVGRSSVREALRILESQGLVKTRPGNRKGVQVTDSVGSSMSRLLNGALRIGSVPLADLVEFRMMIGSTGNFLAAHSRTPEHLRLMRLATEEMEANRDNPEAFARADVAFHNTVQDATGNSVLRMVSGVVESAILDLVHDKISENEEAAFEVRDRFIEMHYTLLKCFEDGRGTDAAAIARNSLLEFYGSQLTDSERARISRLAGTRLEGFSAQESPSEP